MLHKSDYVVLALDEEVGSATGFVAAISDGILSAYIPLLEVLPDYRGRGIGLSLTRWMLAKLSYLYMVLLCDEDLQPFYERLGMVGSRGMMRNYARQAGK